MVNDILMYLHLHYLMLNFSTIELLFYLHPLLCSHCIVPKNDQYEYEMKINSEEKVSLKAGEF